MPTVHLLDYVAGNVRSLVNAINKVGYDVEWIKSPTDIKSAEVSRHLLTVLYSFRLTSFGVSEAYIAGSWPFRPLSIPAFRGRLFRTYQAACRVWQTVYGYLRRAAGAF